MIDQVEKEVDMLERHLHVLQIVIKREPIGIVNLSNKTGYQHHKIRYSLRMLEEASLIEPTSTGAVTTDQTRKFVDEFDGKIEKIIDRVNAMKAENRAEPVS